MEEGISMDIMVKMAEIMSLRGRELKEGTPIIQTVEKFLKLLPHVEILIDQFNSCR